MLSLHGSWYNHTTPKHELEFLLSREVRFVTRTEVEILAGLKELYGVESALPTTVPVVSAEFIPVYQS